VGYNNNATREANMTAAKHPDPPEVRELYVLPLEDVVLFPHATRPVPIVHGQAVKLLGELGAQLEFAALVAVREVAPGETQPDAPRLYEIGCMARVLKIVAMPGERHQYVVFAEGLRRVRIASVIEREPHLRVRVEPLDDVVPEKADEVYVAMGRNVRDLFAEVIMRSPHLSNDILPVLAGIEDDAALTDFVASTLPSLTTPQRQALLEEVDVRKRLEALAEELVKERDNLKLQAKLENDVQQKLAGSQRDFFLREQLKAIQKELGDTDSNSRDIEELRQRIEDAHMPEDVKKEATRELGRLQQTPVAAAEYSVSRTWLDWVVALPWDKSTAQDVDLKRAEEILNEDHHDLEKVKARILEYLAVLHLKRDLKGPILCFVGPPGVGKTSLGRSIARAVGRQFVRLSLGGMHDEAEIRGHRRTYVGALPGQVLQGLRRAGSNDPVFMLDEVDKLGRDFHGDPGSALLEVLDPEQNFSFRDHYLDVPFDLSHVLFITTANVLDSIPPALLDRMEVIELPGYSQEEKLHIAKRFLVPRQIDANGLQAKHIAFTDAGLQEVITSYTHEAGVRQLERNIGSLCRKHAREIAGKKRGSLEVTPEIVRARLGPPLFRLETQVAARVQRPGVAIGLAWTAAGGDILFVEASRMPRDKGEFTITGQIGEVMQESTRAALSWLRANAAAQGIEPGVFKEYDLHLHVPAGAVPKDGPSAGVVMVAALYSLFSGQALRPYLALTGEITLTGHVLPVGGIKEKVLAARRSGIREIVIPADNEANVLEDVPAELREGMQFHYVHTVEEMLAVAFAPQTTTREGAVTAKQAHA
jgi:ATP-dependent Lon protease